MRKVVLSVMTTLDGFTAGPNGELDWIDVADDDLDEHMADVLAGIDGMFFGRVAYELLAQHWPAAEHSTRAVEARQARLMNTLPKYVLSRSAPRTDWGPVRRIGDDLPHEVAQLKAGTGNDLALFAGAGAIAAFAAHDLIDEYCLMIFPVLLEKGIPLPSLGSRRLRPAESTVFDRSGVVLLRYLPAAEPVARKGGSFVDV